MKSMRLGIMVFLVIVSRLLGAQQAEQTSTQGIEVDVNKNLDIIYTHTMESGQTIYQLSRMFGLPPVYLARKNNINKTDDIPIGKNLLIPVPQNKINAIKSNPDDTPIYYTVKAKETIFRIARIYFDIQIDQIMRLNNLKSYKLDIGQKLQIGWLGQPSITNTHPEEIVTEVMVKDTTIIIIKDSIQTVIDTIAVENEIDSSTVMNIPGRKPSYRRGVALCNRNSTSKDLFVLHVDARPNTEIELYNPLSNRRVIAKVVATLPKSAYPDGTDLLVSPRVAEKLGAVDTRFSVEMKYYK